VLLATASTDTSAPVVLAQRLRKGACGSPRGAQRLVADALRTVTRLAPGRPVLLRADSAFYGRPTIGAALPALASRVTSGAPRRRRTGRRFQVPAG
jgi:hypothetical protein